MKSTFTFPSATKQCDILASVWTPADKPRAIVQVAHGMAEHIDRYDEFAQFLNDNGVLVVGNDIAGHGKSVGKPPVYGFFADENGWDCVIADMKSIYTHTKELYPDVPYILFGHSMGSFLARTYASRHGIDMDAFIFCGTAGKNPAVPIAKLIAASEMKKNGKKAESKKLNSLSFGAYNKAFKPNRTEFDWLNRDESEVDKYVADPLCGFVFTSSAFRDLFDGLSEIAEPDWAKKVPNKPILLIAGGSDPVGENGKGVRQVAKLLEKAGHTVEFKLYEGARHEILHEINKFEVNNDILDFINSIK